MYARDRFTDTKKRFFIPGNAGALLQRSNAEIAELGGLSLAPKIPQIGQGRSADERDFDNV
jgi:hypothetical protein